MPTSFMMIMIMNDAGVVFARDILLSMGGQSYGSITEVRCTFFVVAIISHCPLDPMEILSCGKKDAVNVPPCNPIISPSAVAWACSTDDNNNTKIHRLSNRWLQHESLMRRLCVRGVQDYNTAMNLMTAGFASM